MEPEFSVVDYDVMCNFFLLLSFKSKLRNVLRQKNGNRTQWNSRDATQAVLRGIFIVINAIPVRAIWRNGTHREFMYCKKGFIRLAYLIWLSKC